MTVYMGEFDVEGTATPPSPEWDLSGMTLWRCGLCSAVVADITQHSGWHDSLVKQVSAGTTKTGTK